MGSVVLALCACGSEDVSAGASTTSGTGAGGDDGSACACVPAPAEGFSEPVFLWIGEREQAPDCPYYAPFVGYEGGVDLNVPPLACPVCTCSVPEATCVAPTQWTVWSTTCMNDGGLFLAFDAPEGWDGSCTPDDPIPAKLMCGAEPCAQSLNIAPPVVQTGACTPAPSEMPVPEQATLGQYVRACIGLLRSACEDAEEICVAPAPPGFVECIEASGENECPETWPDRHVVYEGVSDDRACAPCTCGPAEGASCSMLVSTYTDSACSDLLTASVMSSESQGAECVTIDEPGAALGSKSASVNAIEPGTCSPAGGDATGAAEATAPATFCCRP